MQDASGSTEQPDPDDNDQSDAVGSPAADDPALSTDIELATSTVVAEVIPGVAVVYGEVPAELEFELLDIGLLPAIDRQQLSNVLASIGNTSTVVGNVGNALASTQGLYRVTDATRALLQNGGKLAVKDSANLGTILLPKGGLAQARFVPVTAVTAAGAAAAIGPALAMVALQMTLNQISGLVSSNIALTSQVLVDIHHAHWSELTGLVTTIDRAVEQAREIESVPQSLWETVAGKRSDLLTQVDRYRLNVSQHVKQIAQLDARRRREYLETNARAITFDTNALLSSLKAWTGYQALHAARARTAGSGDPAEARLVESIARETREQLDSAVVDTAILLSALKRELHIVAELPGRSTLLPTGKRKDAKTARETSVLLLQAIEPVADALRAPAPPLEVPEVVCAPESLDLQSYLRVLRWYVEDNETLRVLGFPVQLDGVGPVKAVVDAALDRLAAARDKDPVRTLVGVTDRRILITKTNTFLGQGQIRADIPIDQVRYVRTPSAQGESGVVVDLITQDENIRWFFPADVDRSQVDAFAAVLAESMTIPDAERDALQQRRYAAIAAGTTGGDATTAPTDVPESGSACDDTE